MTVIKLNTLCSTGTDSCLRYKTIVVAICKRVASMDYGIGMATSK